MPRPVRTAAVRAAAPLALAAILACPPGVRDGDDHWGRALLT